MSEETISESQFSLKTAALRVFDLPLSWYYSVSQIRFSPVAKKLFVVTAVSAISVIFLAHHFKRKRGKKKGKILPWEPEHLILEHTKKAASDKGSSCSSSRQNLTLSLSSTKDKGSQSCNYANGGLFSKYSGSAQSLASVQSVNSCHSCACGNSNSWDKADEDDIKLVNIPVTTPENLYLMGMELFEEALRRWEQALTFRNRQAEDEACGSIKMGAGDAIAEENVDDIISTEFIHKLEALLQRAYRLQEEFEATLGASDPNSLADDIVGTGFCDVGQAGLELLTLGDLPTSASQYADITDRDTDITMKGNVDDFGLRDTLSIASTDSFASAAELAEHREVRHTYSLESLCHCPFYEEAMHLVEEGKIYSRVLRTEMLECLGDSDFLAKLHCIRQAFQVILSESANRIFLAESGRKILSALIVKARKNPKKFEDVFDEMIYFLEQTDHWGSTEMELAARGVKNLNFYDVVLDFILMDSFEDLENPPTSIQNVVNNRWLNSSFKETAVASSCWSVLKQKRQQMKIPDGFFAHFYAICEHISPVLAWGFLGPRNSLYDLCCFFKNQVLLFLKDIFDFEKVRYSSAETLAEDLKQLLIRRTELLMAYLEADALRHMSSCLSGHGHVMPTGLLEAKVQ
ncbi:mitoguardin 1 isoform X1 [Callithrix jacchus]|uniref:mitoguardin 1 isoform X1 n=1 Tax=Callithrix jacchus TaxID=9483 RepID=UPI0023DD62A2|nr:mitoguardin 1 isoform X1 [Callithrix jacchus]XP_054092413.1 mitoguardin 1 isoform X1 [Callithrix jacchus]XP_054092414.1 mitoguardin 1 isoform X1 [Callithrix jacchus]XP_054092416.1 mitoguardin 1 isoform X1 [Callithrix jacchus]